MRIVFALLLLLPLSGFSAIEITDDEQRRLTLPGPVQRIVSLSPHATELLFAAGATDQIVGTVSYSDYPEQAKSIPRIGSNQKLDLERIVALKPDIVIGWRGGGYAEQQETILALGLPVFFSEPASFEAVAWNIRAFGQMLGTGELAEQRAQRFEQELAALADEYSQRSEVTVFYQVWQEPLFTINGEHLITRVIEFCGGQNVFADLSLLAPQIGMEAVLGADPEAIIIGENSENRDWVEGWQRWQGMQAVQQGHIYTIDSDLITRQSPRILQGARLMCDHLDRVRRQRPQ